MNYYEEIDKLKGVGEKSRELLNKCGIYTIMDLLLYFPYDYDNLIYDRPLDEVGDKEKVVVTVKVKNILRDFRSKTGKTVTTVEFDNESSTLTCYWFNQPYMKNKFYIGKEVSIMGKLAYKGNKATISNPVILDNPVFDNQNILPKYSLNGNLTNNFFIKLLFNLLGSIKIEENLPLHIVEKYKLCSLDFAIRNIHLPKDSNCLKSAIRRLKFQELFTYSLKLLLLKNYINENKSGIAFKISEELKTLKELLPFELTGAQSNALREILLDQKKSAPMNRLLQGDVGSGKTIVAIVSLFNVVKNGYQGCIIAPTEILATQHYYEFVNILEKFDMKIELLTGSTTKKNKEIIKEKLKNGEIDIIVGTHAIIEDDVIFKKLGMIITDEQHRFGVLQRQKLYNKSKNADVLVMTATPIPRTLALYLYGDLDVSIINELPPGRQKIVTKYVESSERDETYNFALKCIREGRQVYVVCPLVVDNGENIKSVEALYEELKEMYFKDTEISYLHGKMKSSEKDSIMNSFKSGEIKLLISTTVIEVGVNVPNANLMIIENAERFGLSQLHQLRGRVGRGKHKSYCILVAKAKSKVTEKRLKTMEISNDGFFIAEEDLKLRGSGELFGSRQSGDDMLILSDLMADIKILKCANAEAKQILKSENKVDVNFKRDIIRILDTRSKYICFN
ncbi:MAG: ATP-dependent DNA helicase RecG [Clostridiaceae bacterium]